MSLLSSTWVSIKINFPQQIFLRPLAKLWRGIERINNLAQTSTIVRNRIVEIACDIKSGKHCGDLEFEYVI